MFKKMVLIFVFISFIKCSQSTEITPSFGRSQLLNNNTSLNSGKDNTSLVATEDKIEGSGSDNGNSSNNKDNEGENKTKDNITTGSLQSSSSLSYDPCPIQIKSQFKLLENINLKIGSPILLPLGTDERFGDSLILNYALSKEAESVLSLNKDSGALSIKNNVTPIKDKVYKISLLLNKSDQECGALSIRLFDKDAVVVEKASYFGALANIYDLKALKPLGANAKLPNFSQLSPAGYFFAPNFNYPRVESKYGFPGLPNLKEWFGIQYTTQLNIKETGYYTFKLVSDDGAKFYLDGQELINNDGVHAALEKEGGKYLVQGKHGIQIDWFQGPPFQIHLELFWKTPTVNNFVIIPSDSLLCSACIQKP